MRTSDTMTAVCDFCSDPAVEWDYPCRDFSLRDAAGTFNSREGWAACESCHALIQAGDRAGLARRSSERFHVHHPGSPPIPLSVIRGLQDKFWANREGAPKNVNRAGH